MVVKTARSTTSWASGTRSRTRFRTTCGSTRWVADSPVMFPTIIFGKYRSDKPTVRCHEGGRDGHPGGGPRGRGQLHRLGHPARLAASDRRAGGQLDQPLSRGLRAGLSLRRAESGQRPGARDVRPGSQFADLSRLARVPRRGHHGHVLQRRDRHRQVPQVGDGARGRPTSGGAPAWPTPTRGTTGSSRRWPSTSRRSISRTSTAGRTTTNRSRSGASGCSKWTSGPAFRTRPRCGPVRFPGRPTRPRSTTRARWPSTCCARPSATRSSSPP